MRNLLVASILTLATCTSLAGPTAPPVRAEIDAMLARLQDSGCEFNRNGTWYKAEAAKAHLLRKLDYLEGKTNLQSTEQFIRLAGTSSSMSGRAYQVRCPGTVAIPSAQWLASALAAIRASAVRQ